MPVAPQQLPSPELAAQTIRQQRVARGLTQQDLAERAGVSVDFVRAVEQGRGPRRRSASLPLLFGALEDQTASSSPAQLLRSKRLELGLTQADVAAQAGVSRTSVRNIEKGMLPDRSEVLGRITDTLFDHSVEETVE